MNKATSKSLKVAKYNFGFGAKVTYIITGIIVIVWIINIIIQISVPGYDVDGISTGNFFVLIILLAPIFFAGKHYKMLINIGVKKMDFFKGCLINYAVFAVVVALIITAFEYVIDPLIFGEGAKGLLSFVYAFGWMESGVFACFVYQVGFYLFVSLVIHTLVLYQNMWIGWVADALIIVIITVFIPIAPLREVLGDFFRATMFNPSFMMQFIIDVAIGIVLYISTLYNLAKK
jgi:hypothetical protein